MGRIRIPRIGVEVETSPAFSILNSLLSAGVEIRHDCGGKALCGTCRLRVLSGASGLSPIGPREAERLDAIRASGAIPPSSGTGDGTIRLACQAHASREAEVEIMLAKGGG
ncbi:MAG TPA: 2Fe-2S iron-sulfur cluster-binding protein [Rectinemataceae bacterium]|nr:2Fe-2S iron-sulfur cluster-binding protein [Rectinemataceae bacterium]